MTDPEQLAALAKAVPPDVMRDAYHDLASPLLRQFARFGEDFIKTVRLALFPIQFFSAVQDRVEARLNKAIRQVPDERLIVPAQSIFLPVAERLRFEPDDSVIADLYVNLLSRAMDGERVGEAHPAFVGLISQLAPDEILFGKEMTKHDYTLIVRMNEDWPTPSSDEIDAVFTFMKQPDPRVSRARSMVFNYSSLNQPELFYVFLEHLAHVGLVEYTNEPSNVGDYPQLSFPLPITREETYRRPRIVAIRLSHFGKLFFKACVPTT
jgi:Abortive infection alpha